MQAQRNASPGIRQRHRKDCSRRSRCDCTWQAEVFDAEAGEKIRKTFATRAAARTWRQDALVALREGRIRATTALTLAEAAEAWLEGAREGTIRTRSGDRYKPSAIRGYDRALRLRVLPELGYRRLSDLRRSEVQDLVDQLVADGLAAATIQATVIPLKAICRRELHRGRLAVNPTAGLELPAVRGRRDRIADPAEAAGLVAALDDSDRAVWAAAMYAGLRRGELMALRAGSIDLDANVIHVERGWDDKEGEIETKGRNRRRVPIASALREPLLAHLMRTGRREDDLVFGDTTLTPFEPRRLTDRADAAWKAAGLARICLHECRHTFASLMIAADVNAKALSTYMGHSTIAFTLDKYGHLMPGNEDDAAGLLDAYLTAAVGATK
jgi:integrase